MICQNKFKFVVLKIQLNNPSKNRCYMEANKPCKADEKKAQRTVPAQTKHKQQDMELEQALAIFNQRMSGAFLIFKEG